MCDKKCSRCDSVKHPSEFTKDSRRKDGLRSYCKSCEKSAKDTYRDKNKDAIKQRNHDHHLKRWPAKKKSISKTKSIRRVLLNNAGIKPLWELSEMLGMAESSVRERARRHGISLSTLNHRWTDEDNAKLIEMRNNGITQKQAGIELGRATESVRKQCAKLRSMGYKC